MNEEGAVVLTINLEIEKIDYERSLENLLPQMVEKAAGKPSPSDLERYLCKLGDDAVPVAKKLLSYMDVAEKDAIIVWLVNSRQSEFAATANAHMEETLPGKVVQIGGFYAEDLPGTRLRLSAAQVNIDYLALFSSPMFSGSLVSGAARLALQMMSQEALEKQGVTLLNSELVKPKVLSALSEGLRKSGLAVTFRDMKLAVNNGAAKPGDAQLPDSIKDSLVDALIKWMKDAD